MMTPGFAAPPKGLLLAHHLAQEAASSTKPSMLRRLMASESGAGSLLPDFTVTVSRERSLSASSPVPAGIPISAPSSPIEATSISSNQQINSLRRRSTLQLDQMDVQKLLRDNSLDAAQSSSHQYAPYSDQSKFRRSGTTAGFPTYHLMHHRGWTLGHLAQTMVVMTIFYLVFDAHTKVSQASLRLEHYRNEETILVNQMDRIEGRALQLQQQLKRLREDTMALPGSNGASTTAEAIQLHKDIAAVKRSHLDVDKEVNALQEFLQKDARQEIAERYGPGSLHVNMELGISSGNEGPKSITIELFDETPHANWVWLQQILQGDWKDATFIWHPAHMMLATPSKAMSTKLEFVEKSIHKHQAWTVGLTPSENGSYNFYVNLLDNSYVHDGDVCLGKIVGGFNVLQQLMHVDTKADFMNPPVSISSLHVTTTVEHSRASNNR